jgi:hypothetical protein
MQKGNRSIENVAQFRHFGTIENLIQEEIKRD